MLQLSESSHTDKHNFRAAGTRRDLWAWPTVGQLLVNLLATVGHLGHQGTPGSQSALWSLCASGCVLGVEFLTSGSIPGNPALKLQCP